MRGCTWIKDDPIGMEHAQLRFDGDRVSASSVAIGSEPVPYRLDLELAVGSGWVTRRLTVTARGDGWAISLDLARGAAGTWRAASHDSGTVPTTVRQSVPDAAVPAERIPAHVLDVDVQYSPVTNLMPIRRLGLDHPGASASFVMAWVSVPSLAITLDRQTYTVLGAHDGDQCARFDSGDGFFTAVLRCDDDGVVREYPGIARRLG